MKKGVSILKHVVSQKWLLSHLDQSDLVIVDCRFQFGQDTGRRAYEESHIPGAVYFDMEQELSAPVEEHGGRHPLPDIEFLVARLGNAGISRDTQVVAYDDQDGAMASRFWWLLTYMGHEKVYVLEEGFSAWQKKGYRVHVLQEERTPTEFVPKLRQNLIADVEEVRSAIGNPRIILLDSREAPRYRGEVEPIDKAAGHIPGAINKFWKGIIDEQGRIKTTDAIAANFNNLPRDKEIIVYCGSGVTATPNILGLIEAGFKNVKLYPGSWSDWISYSENPIATGEEKEF